MGPARHHLAILGLEALVASGVLSVLMALMVVACRQPSRRLFLARMTWFALLAVVPAMVVAGGTRFDSEVSPAIVPWIPWMRLALVAYLSVALGFGCWLAVVCLVGRWLVRVAIPPRPFTAQVVDSLPYDGWLRRPGVRVSRHLGRPMLVGFFRPTILIPTHFERHDAVDHLTLAISHELAHAEHLDSVCGLLGGVAQAFWFVFPQVWWLRDQSRLDQEFLADRRAARRLGRSEARYAATLMEVLPVGSEAAPRPEFAQGGSSPHIDPVSSALVQRILMLVRCPFPIEGRTPLWWRILMPAIAFGGLVLLGTAFSRFLDPFASASAGPSENTPRLIEFPRLTVACDHDRTAVEGCALPVVLPPSFTLEFEILARRLDIPLHAFAGLHVLPALREDGWTDQDEQEAWWHVRIEQSPNAPARAWLDQRETRVRPWRGASSTRLTIHSAPGRNLQLRHVTLH